jgi:hypothetical protein
VNRAASYGALSEGGAGDLTREVYRAVSCEALFGSGAGDLTREVCRAISYGVLFREGATYLTHEVCWAASYRALSEGGTADFKRWCQILQFNGALFVKTWCINYFINNVKIVLTIGK